MKISKIKTLLISVVALTAAATTMQSHAQGNWYLGGGVSQAFVDERGIDEDDTGGKIYGGYKLNSYFAIEGGYYDFGEISDRGSQLELDGLSIAAVGIIPVSPHVSLFGKAGVHDWDADTVGPISAQLRSNSDTDAFYGVGIEYTFDNRWAVRGEAERYEVEDLDVDVFSIGLSYNF